MVGTTTEGLHRDVAALVRDGKIKRAAAAELTVVHELTDRERDSFWRYIGRLGVEVVGERYL
jgi:hypothetical protein